MEVTRVQHKLNDCLDQLAKLEADYAGMPDILEMVGWLSDHIGVERGPPATVTPPARPTRSVRHAAAAGEAPSSRNKPGNMTPIEQLQRTVSGWFSGNRGPDTSC